MPKLTIEFLQSVADVTDFSSSLPEVIIFGRSNVGKSTFINSLAGTKVAKTSSTPGRTQLLNYFLCNNNFYLVDAPGYGYAKTSMTNQQKMEDLIISYLNHRKNLKLVILLIDSRLPIQKNDLQMLNTLLALGLSYLVVATKADKLNQKDFSRHKKEMAAYPFYPKDYFLVSSIKLNSYQTVLQRILEIFDK